MERYHVNNSKRGLPWFLLGIGGFIVIFGEEEFRYYPPGQKGGEHNKIVDIEDLEIEKLKEKR